MKCYIARNKYPDSFRKSYCKLVSGQDIFREFIGRSLGLKIFKKNPVCVVFGFIFFLNLIYIPAQAQEILESSPLPIVVVNTQGQNISLSLLYKWDDKISNGTDPATSIA